MFALEFYGTRGSTPISRQDVVKYGGNTTCILIHVDERDFIIDCGTGLLNMQDYILKKDGSKRINIFLTHIHWDHIQAIAFFAPFFIKKYKFDFYGEYRYKSNLRKQIADVMDSPMFPVCIDAFNAEIEYRDIQCGNKYCIDGVFIDTIRLRHPNICTGYRFTYGDKSICLLSDFEHSQYKGEDDVYITFAKNCDVLIYDAQYTTKEFEAKLGWGHSTWEKAIEMAQKANAKRVFMTHHDPMRKDSELDKLQETVEKIMPSAIFAKEGMFFEL